MIPTWPMFPSIAASRSISPRQIAPIVQSRCVACHHAGEQGTSLDLGTVADYGGQAGENSIACIRCCSRPRERPIRRPVWESMFIRVGARTSPLVWHILGRNTSRPWDGAAIRGIARSHSSRKA